MCTHIFLSYPHRLLCRLLSQLTSPEPGWELLHTEYCGKVEAHDYELYLGVNGIEHSKTKARHPQTNGICERLHKTILQEFYQVAFLRKLYHSLEELQTGLDAWIAEYTRKGHVQAKCAAVERSCGHSLREVALGKKGRTIQLIGQSELLHFMNIRDIKYANE